MCLHPPRKLTAPRMNALTLCLVSDNPVVITAVQVFCQAPHQVHLFSRDRLVNDHHTLSDYGAKVVDAAAAADALLIEWVFDEAPVLNTLCFHVRKNVQTPIFMVHMGGPETAAACIAAGADDVVAFPLHLPYVQAKILSYRRLVKAAQEATLLFPGSPDGPRPSPNVRNVGPLHLDLTAHRFYIYDTEVALTPREFALLGYLIANVDILCTRDQILDAVWGINFDTGTNMVDVYMYFLRKKLEAHGLKEMLQTVRGHGYRLVPPEQTTA